MLRPFYPPQAVHLAQTDCEAQPSPENWVNYNITLLRCKYWTLLQGLARTTHREPPVLGAAYSYDPEGLYMYITFHCMSSCVASVLGEGVNAYVIDT